jgi:hypothetical protein
MPDLVTLQGKLAAGFQDLKPGSSLVCRIVSILDEKVEDQDGVRSVVLDVTKIKVEPEIEDFDDAAVLGEYQVTGGSDFIPSPG